ncbi:hypothetical protein ACWESM_18700 [Nocardia sp. NPDC003999]
MTGDEHLDPARIPVDEAAPLLRAAVQSTAVALLAGWHPTRAGEVVIHEVRKCMPDEVGTIPDPVLARALRDFADHLDARHVRRSQR